MIEWTRSLNVSSLFLLFLYLVQGDFNLATSHLGNKIGKMALLTSLTNTKIAAIALIGCALIRAFVVSLHLEKV